MQAYSNRAVVAAGPGRAVAQTPSSHAGNAARVCYNAPFSCRAIPNWVT